MEKCELTNRISNTSRRSTLFYRKEIQSYNLGSFMVETRGGSFYTLHSTKDLIKLITNAIYIDIIAHQCPLRF